MEKCLEGKVCEEQLGSVGVLNPEQSRLWGGLMTATWLPGPVQVQNAREVNSYMCGKQSPF